MISLTSPSLKVLALSFLMIVGTLLIAEAFEVQVPRLHLLDRGHMGKAFLVDDSLAVAHSGS